MREVAEETGVLVSVERLTGVYKNLTLGVVALVYRCHPVSGQAHATDESSQTRWVTRSDVDTLMTEAYAIRIHDAYGETPASRAHDGRTVVP